MRVLIIGGGGREHALAVAVSRSPLLEKLYCAPGNAGIAQVAQCVSIGVEELDAICRFVDEERINLVVIGPERPLIMGLADRLRAQGKLVYGPNAAAARLEGSKAFTSQLLSKYGLSAKEFTVFDDADAAKNYLKEYGAPVVVKADGDALGKGVKVCSSVAEAEQFVDDVMVNRLFGSAGDRVIIEQRLVGEECTIKVFTDSDTIVPMVPSQDHKRIGEKDTGANTGGMGCYSPVPSVDASLQQQIIDDIVAPTIYAMADEGAPYSGTLYAGCILTAGGPELIEYNCRFGDPEAQVVIPRLESDLLEVLTATAEGKLEQVSLQWSGLVAACVVAASAGYPDKYEKGRLITGLDEAATDDLVYIYHAGTTCENGAYYTSGGRVLGVTALGSDYDEAFDRAYAAMGKIHFEGMYFRRDIGWRARERVATRL
jgi:phosphoribosylamine--glycine ligase